MYADFALCLRWVGCCELAYVNTLDCGLTEIMQSADNYEPLIGNVAPDFEAEAVFDQEFIKVGVF